ncbi:MAG: ASCH domain-containing protein [Acidobacteriota bacterium]|nr:ASCH domain-containing protein [Acidobacteriota bacterium]
MPTKALTICQPFPELILRGLKPIENRTWATHYRGELLIHAGLSKEWMEGFDLDEFPGMRFGAVVGIARLSACLPKTGTAREDDKWGPWRKLYRHEHANGPWCWVLENVRKLSEPLEVRGAQGLWTPPDWLLARVQAMKLERVA